MSRVLLQASNIKKSYTMGNVRLDVLRGASLQVRQGEMLAITGSSGCGKSTLLHILGALDEPNDGAVTLDGERVFVPRDQQPAHRRRAWVNFLFRRYYMLFPRPGERRRDRMRNERVGFVFQFYHLMPELNVLENVLMPAMIGESILAWTRHRRRWRERALAVLERVGLQDRLKHRPNALSGGERQRVAIARAVIREPRLLLADEPTGNLDAEMSQEILTLLRSLNAGGQTIVLVTHDAEIAAAADREVRLVRGRIEVIADAPAEPAHR